jgi:crotonobetainyl-CoA:carnitine CoA-transferase CaiB-like acyl-CoA transferase
MTTPNPLPLAGIQVIEIGGGAAAAYCGRLLADAGAQVISAALSEDHRQAGIVRADLPTEHAYAAYLSAGKQWLPASSDALALAALCRAADLVLVGEASGFEVQLAQPKVASVALSWFGALGERRHWQGSDLIVQALTGMPQMAGARDGPPLAGGDRQATTLGGVTAYIAACAALLAKPTADSAAAPRRLEVSILEANLVLAEMHMYFFERDGLAMQRWGLNRFAPNSPVGIYPCRDGFVGITVATPDQWRGLCQALDLQAQAADSQLATRELRFARLDEVENVLCAALAHRSADEWAALGRQYRVPIVPVPDASGILRHPVFAVRQSLAGLVVGGVPLQVPRTPFGLSATPIATTLLAAEPQASRADPVDPLAAGLRASTPATELPAKAQAALTTSPSSDPSAHANAPPLQGLTLVDFSMGWAGPLSSRLMADLGAEVIKIEAGRYPDWWRGMNWTPEFIATRQHEHSTTFCGLNRGKRGISLDLTQPAGRELALALVAGADAVIENQAAGVMNKFGLGYAQLAQARPDLVMVSMSAFGTGNAWSDTRAYGSTLEQGSGLPSFTGLPGTAPTMTHLAHGDPVGGLYGCAALLTALVHRRRSGQGQYVNLSMVEAMLQFTTPALLTHQLSPDAALRHGNQRPALAPHGIYPSAGTDQWVALAVQDGTAFAALAGVLGRADWAADASLLTLAGRQQHAVQIEAAISVWTQQHSPEHAAQVLQAAGVLASPLLHAQHLAQDAHLLAADFFIDLDRAVSGPQRQGGLAIRQGGQRLGARTPAPLLGEHSQAVLQAHASVGPDQFAALVRDGIVSFSPKPVRNLVI